LEEFFCKKVGEFFIKVENKIKDDVALNYNEEINYT
jgi:hypothetical protein